jgi:hypothetical protein
MAYSTPVSIPPLPPQPESYIRKRTHSFSVQPYGTVPTRRTSGSNSSGAAGGVSRRQAIYGPNALAAVSFPTMQPASPSAPAATVITIPASPALSAARHASTQSTQSTQSVDIEERPVKKQKRKEKEALAKTPSRTTTSPPPVSAPTSKPSSRFNIFLSRSLSVGDAITAASPKIKTPTPKRLSLPVFGKSRTDGVRTPSPAPLSAVFPFSSISPPRSPSPTKVQISTPRAPSPTKMKPTPIVSSTATTATTTNLAASMPRLKRTPTKSIELRQSPLRRSPPRAKSASKVSEDLDMMIVEEEEEVEATSPLSPPGLSTAASTDVMEVDKGTPAVRRGEFLSQPRRLPKCERASTPEPPAVLTVPCPSPNNSTPRFNRIPTPPSPPPRFSSPLGPVRRILPPRSQFPRPPKSEQLVHLGGDKLRIRCGEKGRPLFVQSLGQQGQAAEMYRKVVTRNAKIVWRETCELRRRERKDRLLGGEDEGYTLRVAAEAAAAASVKKEKDGEQKPKEKRQIEDGMDLDGPVETPSDLDSLPDIPDMEDDESDRTHFSLRRLTTQICDSILLRPQLMFASHPTISNNFIKRKPSIDKHSTHIHNIICNSLSHLQNHFHSIQIHSKLNTPSLGMPSSSSPAAQLTCVALLLRARRRKRGFYHSLPLGAVPLDCPSRRPPLSAHPVHPLSAHESHLALEHGRPRLVPHHTLISSILCISLACLSFTLSSFLIPSHLQVMVLVEQPINLYQDHIFPLHTSQLFLLFPCTVSSPASCFYFDVNED